jgi:hypothetical protein
MFEYCNIPGLFSAAPHTKSDPVHVPNQPPSFGLVMDNWDAMKQKLAEIKKQAIKEHPQAVVKLIYLGRHGEGKS